MYVLRNNSLNRTRIAGKLNLKNVECLGHLSK
jgi:hypothetical protein